MKAILALPAGAATARPHARRRRVRSGASLVAQGQPMMWLTAGTVVIALVMTLGLLLLILVRGLGTFWPAPLARFEMVDGSVHLGEVTRRDRYRPTGNVIDSLPAATQEPARELLGRQRGWSTRWLVRTGNFDVTGVHFTWVDDFALAERATPEWAVIFERLTWGRFYGEPTAFLVDGAATANGPEAAWREFERHHPTVEGWRAERRRLERGDIGDLNHRLEAARLRMREAALVLEEARDGGAAAGIQAAAQALASEQAKAAAVESEANAEYAGIRARIDDLQRSSDRYQLSMRLADGAEVLVPLGQIVRGYPANRLGLLGKLSIYLSRWAEFLTADPREANSEGGVFPAIFGTVVMTLLMSLAVVPFGVIAALYLREYARPGRLVSTVRIAINNLAGVPSIVFGVFGLGFFSYLIGGGIDELFFRAKLPSPTFGTGGILWASLTLALLTLPVVIVATEEALAAVPGSMREGSYACGASKWQTIKRIVMPRAMPGIMTGMILAMARGAGEVAPLMLVGAVKLAPELPIDRYFPFVHLERSFMHLGFHIFDVGFQSQNSQAAIPMVFTSTLLLILIIVLLNVTAIRLRSRLHRRFSGSQF